MNTDILFEGESEKSRESFCMKLEILEIIADDCLHIITVMTKIM